MLAASLIAAAVLLSLEEGPPSGPAPAVEEDPVPAQVEDDPLLARTDEAIQKLKDMNETIRELREELELPEMCRPWRPSPESRQLSVEENPVFEGRKDRKFCSETGKAGPGEDPTYEGVVTCDTFADLNMHWFASEHLYPMSPDGYRAPYGSGSECDRPVTVEEVTCHLDLNGTDFQPVARIDVVCRGDKFCGKDEADKCCRVVRRNPPTEEQIRWSKPPTKEEEKKWLSDRCDRLEERRETCRPFCTNPAYSEQCAGYWNYFDPECLAL